MAGGGNRGIAFMFGVLGAILLIVAAAADFIGGFVLLAFGSGGHALGAWGRSVIDIVMALLVGLFSVFGRSGDRERTLAAGVVLVVLAFVGWFALGLAGEILALVGVLFALIAGILFLVTSA
ncbi:MAG TPA: hypothetical protein VEG66_08515 [Thermoplasmata archaeon]|jgi:hypothetical protein|nr:hypothetical protein [Thermoplasmata archaeon]